MAFSLETTKSVRKKKRKEGRKSKPTKTSALDGFALSCPSGALILGLPLCFWLFSLFTMCAFVLTQRILEYYVQKDVKTYILCLYPTE